MRIVPSRTIPCNALRATWPSKHFSGSMGGVLGLEHRARGHADTRLRDVAVVNNVAMRTTTGLGEGRHARPARRRGASAQTRTQGSGDFQLEVVQVALGQVEACVLGELNPLDVPNRAAIKHSPRHRERTVDGRVRRAMVLGEDAQDVAMKRRHLRQTSVVQRSGAPLHEDAPPRKHPRCPGGVLAPVRAVGPLR